MIEDELIARFLQVARDAGATTDGPLVALGPGDDAAVLRPPPDQDLAWTVDDHVEGVHFRAAWGLEAAGRKAVGACLSDLAAMGAVPLGALVALHLPRGLDEGAVAALARGVGAALAAVGCPLLGGNVSAHPTGVSLSTSALGAVPRGGALTRGAARAGDALHVTGPLGLARAGLRWLEADRPADDPLAREAVAALLAPQPRFDVARALAARPAGARVACMDLSDGLARDLPRLLRASGVAATVDSDALPAPPRELARALDPDDPSAAARLAWLGGEDYQLLLAAPPGLLAGYPVIGRVEPGEPGAVRVKGVLRDDPALAAGGFDHFG